jgi:hypothetical protein
LHETVWSYAEDPDVGPSAHVLWAEHDGGRAWQIDYFPELPLISFRAGRARLTEGRTRGQHEWWLSQDDRAYDETNRDPVAAYATLAGADLRGISVGDYLMLGELAERVRELFPRGKKIRTSEEHWR